MGIDWYEAVSMEALGSFLAIFLVIAFFVFVLAKKAITRILLLGCAISYVGFGVYYEGQRSAQAINALQDQLLEFEQAAKRYDLPYREELNAASLEIAKAQTSEVNYVGGIFLDNRVNLVISGAFISEDQFRVFSQFIEYCYHPDLVESLWDNKLEGYPVLAEDARASLEYAQARSDSLKPECLGSVTTLSFLK